MVFTVLGDLRKLEKHTAEAVARRMQGGAVPLVAADKESAAVADDPELNSATKNPMFGAPHFSSEGSESLAAKSDDEIKTIPSGNLERNDV